MWPVWFREPSGAADERAVGVKLHGGDAEAVVAEGGSDTDGGKILQMVRQGHQRHAQAKYPASGGFAIDAHFAAGHLRVADGSEPGGEIDLARFSQERDGVFAGED